MNSPVMTNRFVIGLDVAVDLLVSKEELLTEELVELKKIVYNRERAYFYIPVSILQELREQCFKRLSKYSLGKTKNEIYLVTDSKLKKLLKVVKLAKTPSYIDIDLNDISVSQIIGSVDAIDGILVTHNHISYKKNYKKTVSVLQALEFLRVRPQIPFIDLERQYRSIDSEIEKRIDKVLNHGQYIMGPEVQELEDKLAQYVGVKHVITCANGTDALLLALMALNLKEGDAVFCPTFTFFATAEVIPWVRAEPVFVDSDSRTFNICPIDLEKRIKAVIDEGRLNPKAIIAVDLFGLPADYPELQKIANKYKLKLVEDAAQSFGASIDGKKTGSFGDIATTSFFPAKPLGCYGDGGAVFTDNDEYAELIRSYQVHGKGKDKYDNVQVGMNSRLDTIQSAILLEKIKILDIEIQERLIITENYKRVLKNLCVGQYIPEGYFSSWAQFTVCSNMRESLIDRIREQLPVMVYYPRCVHLQPAFRKEFSENPNLPISESLSNSVFSLPINTKADLSFLLK